jgi:hypothetical protein
MSITSERIKENAFIHALADDAAEEIEALEKEIERLNQAFAYEQHRAERIGTHGPDCWKWGPAHYECAMREIERLTTPPKQA